MGRRRAQRAENPQLKVWKQQTSRGAEGDLALALDLLAGTRTGHTPPMLRIYRPQPTVAFGQRDTKLPGFNQAAGACRRLGFTPVVRRAGGRAAAYHPGSLVIDHIEPDTDPIRESLARFSAFGELYTEALRHAGIDAELGPVPYEYCYGEHSVHGVAPGEPDVRIKLVGTAQRQIATGWLFSTSIVVTDGAPIRRVLTEAYSAMGLEWDPLSAGAADDLIPGVSVDDVEHAILQTYSRYWELATYDVGS
ncbi:lipoate--protein ligase family protein [Nesterenkonia alba]|uniref:lipoate--protein ligase family protein n=1 Tax=Nesterenkonia alba TaxID=515814 RepID=UPI0003B40793|nr:lipoate--protein ligase A [Nesterenkonia alba]